MTQTELLVEDIRQATQNYVPSVETREALHGVDPVLIVGPLAVGKTSVIQAIEEQDGDFGLAPSLTTRPRRAGEEPDAYEFIPHTPEHLKTILREVEDGAFVQCTVHENGHVYGTRPEAYKQQHYVLLAPVVGEVDKMRKLFDDVKVFGLVAPTGDYIQRLDPRLEKMPKEAARGVLADARISLEWLLAQPSDSMRWIMNRDEQEADAPGTRAAQIIMNYVKEPHPANTMWRQDAKKMLQAIEERQELLPA